MGVFDDGYQQAVIDAGRNPVDRPPAGYIDAFLATYEATKQEDLSIAERQNFLNKVKERNQLIEEKTGQPIKLDLFEPGLVQPGQLSTTAERARLAYNKQVREFAAIHPDIKTDEDLEIEIKEDSRRIRERSGKVLENTTFGGKIGSFVGAMAATLEDPLVFGTIPFGASWSAGVLRTALTEAGIGALSEALIQPFVWRYKKKLESPYDLGEAATRIAAAGVGSAVLGGTIKGAAKGIARLKKPRLEGLDDLLETHEQSVIARQAQGLEPTTAERDAAHVLGDYADIARESPFDLGDPAADMRHLEATGKAISDVEAGQPVDVREIVTGMEPREELRTFTTVAEVKERLGREGLSAKHIEALLSGRKTVTETVNDILGIEKRGKSFESKNLEIIEHADGSRSARFTGPANDLVRPGNIGTMSHVDAILMAQEDAIERVEAILVRLPREELRGEPAFVRGEGVTPKRGPGIEEPTQAKPLEPGGGKQPFEMTREEFDRTGLEVGSNLKERWTRVVYATNENRLLNLKEHFPTDRQTPLIRETPEQVTVYRAVPGEAEEIRPGDWVALERKYAGGHLEGRKRGKIISEKVSSEDVVWAGTDENEFFYAPKRFSRPEAPTTYDALQELATQRPERIAPPSGGGERVRIIDLPKAPTPATENQSLGQFVKNSGGVSVEGAGALRGEYDALYEGGGRKAGIVKKKSGLSAAEMAERAQEAGFIDEADPALLAELLDRDLRGDKVYSAQGSRFERKLELDVERATSEAVWERWALVKEPEYVRELEMRARGILEAEDVEISMVARAEGGELKPLAGREAAEAVEAKEATIVRRSAREFIQETEEDAKMGSLLRDCLIKG